MNHFDRVCATIDLDAMLSNMDAMHQNLKPGTKMLAVIKTDGYGHGATAIANELEDVDYVFGYATATAEEALKLRKAGIKKPILILGYVFPYAYEALIKNDVRLAAFKSDMVKELSETAKRIGISAKVHIKVDTAMSRIGIRPDEENGLAFVREVLSSDMIEAEGIFTHFAKADEADKTAVYAQLKRYIDFLSLVHEKTGYRFPIEHCSNSAGIIELPEANMDMVRAGITVYGLWPSDEVSQSIVALAPVLSLTSHIVYIKEIEAGTSVSYGGTFTADHTMKIATIPVGYGDGYPRLLSNKGSVLIRGMRAPILGRVCMDQFMVDVSDIPDVAEYDTVTLIGEDGNDRITMEELGELSGRFNYELACDLGKRIPRVFMKNGVCIGVLCDD
ncbi:MAG: alanine racemase [Lachnospiraceae bacterium]|nr:alanine racemase [Lachnospiraceae bacterium]